MSSEPLTFDDIPGDEKGGQGASKPLTFDDTTESKAPLTFEDAEPKEASTLETAEDYGRDIMAGFSQLGGGVGWALDQVGADSIGQTLMEKANDSARWWLEGQSAEAKYDRSRDFLETDEDGNYQLGDFNMGTVLHQTAQSLPATGLGLGAGGAAAKGLGALGAGAKTAGAVGYGSGEAAVAAPMVGSEVYDEVKRTDHDTLYENSEAYAKLYDQLDGLDEDRRQELATDVVAESASRDAALMAGGSTFALSAPAGAVMPNMPLGKVMDQSRATGAIKGGATETAQEFFQEGSEGVATNIAAQLHYDPERGTFEGVPNQALGGALSGTAMGTAFGAGAKPQPKGPPVDSSDVIGEAEEVRVEGDQPTEPEGPSESAPGDRRRQDEIRAAKDDAINRGADPQAILDTANQPVSSSDPEAQKDEMVARFNELGPRQEAAPEPETDTSTIEPEPIEADPVPAPEPEPAEAIPGPVDKEARRQELADFIKKRSGAATQRNDMQSQSERELATDQEYQDAKAEFDRLNRELGYEREVRQADGSPFPNRGEAIKAVNAENSDPGIPRYTEPEGDGYIGVVDSQTEQKMAEIDSQASAGAQDEALTFDEQEAESVEPSADQIEAAYQRTMDSGLVDGVSKMNKTPDGKRKEAQRLENSIQNQENKAKAAALRRIADEQEAAEASAAPEPEPEPQGDLVAEPAAEPEGPKLPTNFDDVRLRHPQKRDYLEGLASQFEKQDGVGKAIKDADGRATGRVQSSNPEWAQDLLKKHSYDTNQVKTAVDKALKGQRLSNKQAEVVSELLDKVENDRAEYEAPEARERLERKREERRQARELFGDESGDALPDEEFESDPELDDLDADDQVLFDRLDKAREAGVADQDIEDTMEMDPERAVARVDQLIEEANRGEPAESVGVGQEEASGRDQPEAEAQDDFAQLDPDEQRRLQQQRDLANAQQARDEQRQGTEGQVGLDEGGGGPDLFSPEAQTDMLDQGAEDSTGATQEGTQDQAPQQTPESATEATDEATAGDSGTKFQVGDRVVDEEGDGATVRSIMSNEDGGETFYEVEADGGTLKEVPEGELISEAEFQAEFEADQEELSDRLDRARDQGLSYSLTQAARSGDLPGAPVYFSAALEGARAIKSDKGPPKHMLKQLKNQPGVKQEELDWLGMDAWIDSQEGKVTRDQLIDFIEANQIEVDEVVYGGEAPDVSLMGGDPRKMNGEEVTVYEEMRSRQTFRKRRSLKTGETTVTGPNGEEIPFNGSMEQSVRQWMEEQSLPEDADYPAEHDNMRPWGGVNYREIVLTAPQAAGEFLSGHFAQPRQLAHVRIDERYTSDDSTVLTVVETQSDRAGQGNRKGWAKDIGEEQARSNFAEAVDTILNEFPGFGEWFKEQDSFLSLGFPDHLETAMNKSPVDTIRAFDKWRDHSDRGLVKVDQAYTTAAEAKRATKLSEALHEASQDIGEAIGAPDGRVAQAPLQESWDMLVMKRMVRYAAERGFDRIAWPSTGEQVAAIEGWKTYERRGDKHYVGDQDVTNIVERYTKRLPNALSKYGKRWGAKVSKVEVETGMTAKGEPDFETYNSLELTPEMRNYALGGQPLFSLARDKSAGMSKADLDSAVQAYKQTTGSQREVVSVADETQLPPAHFRQLAADGVFGQAEGYLDPHTGRTYLIGANLSGRQRAMEVMAHEELHAGLRETLGDQVKPVLNEVARKKADETGRVARQYGLDLNVSSNRHVAAEEVLARMAERGEESTSLDRLVSMVRDFLRKLGVKAGLSQSELRIMVSRAGRAARSGNARAYMMGDTRYSVAPAEQGKQPRHSSVLRQPIDQIFRLPFKATFGLDDQGRLKYPEGAHRAADKLRESYKGARSNIQENAPWLDHWLERAERGLIDDLGSMPDQEAYKASRESLSTDERRYAKFAIDLYERMVSQGVDKSEARVLHDMIVGDAPTEGDLANLADPIKAAISELGQDMVANGTLSREAFERWDGQYLHRFYQESTGANSGVGAFVTNMMTAKRKKLYEQSYKGRGMQVEVATKKIVDQISDDWWGKADGKGDDAAVQGQRFHMFDFTPQSQEGDFFAESEASDRPNTLGQKGKVKERVLIPEGMPIPERYTRSDSEYTNRGTWEARKAEAGTTTLWRDFTKPEREYMGEITDARYTVTKTFHLAGHNVAVGNWYKTLAENEAWARDYAPEEAQEADRVADKNTRVQDRTYAGYDWVQVPNEKVPQSDTFRYGALSGKFVRAEIWRDIQEYDRMHNSSSLWQTILTQWKLNKALALDTPIPTADGWTTMGEIRVGDRVFDEKGQPCSVMEVKDIRHNRPCYEVKFSDGASIVADDEHYWYTVMRNQGGDVRTTQEIRETLAEPTRGDRNHSVPVADEMDLPDASLPLSPYTLGLWLGDGHSDSPRITVGSRVADEVAAHLANEGVHCGTYCYDSRSTAVTFTIDAQPVSTGSGANLAKQALEGLGVFGEKAIPGVYKRASIRQRRDLLQGLMDADGWVTTRGTCGFATSLAAMRDDALELLRSLGYKPTVGEIETKAGKPAWRIHFQAYADKPVARLAEKAERLRERPVSSQRSSTRQIVAIEPVESVPVRCISVNSDSHLYLAGDAMIPTHNTARNPVVHTNNVMSNMLFMDMQDVTFADLKDAVRAFYNHKTNAEGDPDYMDARDHNAFQGLFAEAELNHNVLDPVLQEINEEQAAEADQAGMWSKEGATRMWRLTEKMWHAFDNATTEAYQSEDEVFRLAVYMKKVREGMSKEDAAPLARKSMLDYDISAPWINNLRRSVLPFISYTYRAVPVVAESMVHRPWKLLKYGTVAHVAQAMSYAIAGGDEEEERKALREDQQGYTWIGVPRMLRTPFGDEDNPVYLDIKRWVPVGDVFDTNQGQIDFLPAPLQFAGPLMLGAEFYLNKVSFTGEDIMDRETDTAMEQAQGYADWLWKSWMPSAPWIPNSWYWEKIGAAARGGTSSMGTPYSMTAAISSSMGVKANPVNVKEGKMWRAKGIKWKIDKVQKGMRDDIMEYKRNLIDKDELNERLETHRNKIERYQEDFEDLL